jgi:hypothetical protein
MRRKAGNAQNPLKWFENKVESEHAYAIKYSLGIFRTFPKTRKSGGGIQLIMAAANAGQQGITKRLSGANAAFNDKVGLIGISIRMSHTR